jgi:outer membrane protein OmpA-like peptidoglycan-associated protein
LGNSGLAGGAAVAGSAEAGAFTFSGDVGMQFDPASVSNTDGANSVLVGMAIGASPADGWGLTAETRLEPSFIEDPVPGTGSPSEMLYHARYKAEGGFHFMFGAGHAITSGPGAAVFRTFVGLGWESKKDRPPRDTDGDGIPDRADECVDEAETVNGWRDMDGCPDDLGRLNVRVMLADEPVEGAEVRVVGPKGPSTHTTPRVPRFEGLPGEEFTATATYGVCYAGEGARTLEPGKNRIRIELARIERSLKVVVKTAEGEPVNDAFVKWLAPEDNFGCHATGEASVNENGEYNVMLGIGNHELVVQAEERSPQRFEVGINRTKDEVLEVTMKAAKTKLSAERIEILEKVFFETGSDVIKSESFELLTEVATVLIANPQIKKVQIAGHTDSKGKDDFNKELSQQRADSVRSWLVEHDVPAERLEAVGYGETEPIASNGSRKGRAQNRRVEFVIVDSAPTTDDAEKE